MIDEVIVIPIKILNSFSSEALKRQAAFSFEGRCFEFLASEFDHALEFDILELGILDFWHFKVWSSFNIFEFWNK